MQVSLRDPLRLGADDDALREVIGAAVCILQSFHDARTLKKSLVLNS